MGSRSSTAPISEERIEDLLRVARSIVLGSVQGTALCLRVSVRSYHPPAILYILSHPANAAEFRRSAAVALQRSITVLHSVLSASDLDCIRALFNEKEKELSLAVAKVEELTRQLEELRGRHNGGTAGGPGPNGQMSTPASAELEKLRRELMVSRASSKLG